MPQPISNGLILSIIEKGLDKLGNSPKSAIWYCLEKDYGFTHETIPENLKGFESILQKIFGLGYSFLDALFKQYLQDATGENLEGYRTFAESVEALRFKQSLYSMESKAILR